MKFLLKQPSAWIPLAMSLTAFLLVISNIIFFGIARDGDESTAAHIFQLLLLGQLPFVIYFAIKWLPKKSTHAISILLLQAAAGLVALAPVLLLDL